METLTENKDCKTCKHRACMSDVFPCYGCTDWDDDNSGHKNYEPIKHDDLMIGTDYLHVSVYRNADIQDCTNGGISSKYNKLILIAEDVKLERVEQFCNKNNYDINTCVQVYTRNLQGHNYVVVTPIHLHTNNSKAWTMFGGNYIGTSDSRFKNITKNQEQNPIAIHDRQE